MLKKPKKQNQKSKPADSLLKTSKKKDIELTEKELGKVTGGAVAADSFRKFKYKFWGKASTRFSSMKSKIKRLDSLKHLRQVRADQVTALVQLRVIAVRAIALQIMNPSRHVRTSPVLRNELGNVVTTLAGAVRTLDP
jgi:hypothetical protein